MEDNIQTIFSVDEYEFGFFLQEVKQYLETVYEDMTRSLKLRYNQDEMDDQATFEFFRTKDRIDNIMIILQYLLHFSEKSIPTSTEDNLEEQFEQFKEAVCFQFGLLLEDDVKKALYKELIPTTPDHMRSREYFENKIQEEYDTLMHLVKAAQSSGVQEYTDLFDGLIRYYQFWFEVKTQSFNKIRKSDMYIYRLSKYLYKHIILQKKK